MTAPTSFPSAAAQCREHIAELAGVIAIGAEIITRQCELGDDAAVRYQLQRLILHVRAAARTYKDLAELENARRAESEAAP